MDELRKILKQIREKQPENFKDFKDLLVMMDCKLEEVIEKIQEEITEKINNKDFQDIEDLTKFAQACTETQKEIEIFLKENDGEKQEKNEDKDVVHYLYEDFTGKKPFGFKIEDSGFTKVSSWKEMLVKTCKLLHRKDSKKFLNFENISYLNGKTRKHFTKDKSLLNNPELINGEIYAETNLSSKGTCKLIKNIIKEYDYNIKDYRIYLKFEDKK